MEKIFNFSSFSALYEDVTGATAATDAEWYPYLSAIVTGIISEAYMPLIQLAPSGAYKNMDSDFKSINDAKTLEDKIPVFEKILTNASGVLSSKDPGYKELKKISEEYMNVGKKYISALPVLKEKSGTKGDEISNAIPGLMKSLNGSMQASAKEVK